MDQRPGEKVKVRRRTVHGPATERAEMEALDQEAISSAEALREQIARSRADLAETMEAIEEKLDREHLKRRAEDEIFAATVGKVESRLKEAQRQVREAASAMGRTAVTIALAVDIHTEGIRAQLRERTWQMGQVVTSVASHAPSASRDQVPEGGTAIPHLHEKALPARIAQLVSTGILRARWFAQVLAHRIRA